MSDIFDARCNHEVYSEFDFVEKSCIFLRLKQWSYILLNLNLAIVGCYKEI